MTLSNLDEFIAPNDLFSDHSHEQFATSPDLPKELQNAIMESYDAHTSMSTQALNSPAVLRGIMDILIHHSHLYETLREQAVA